VFPEIFPGVRRALLHAFPYAVYLKPTEQAVIIVAVLHLSRNPTVWHRRLGQPVTFSSPKRSLTSLRQVDGVPDPEPHQLVT
jgi:hypothetical protein